MSDEAEVKKTATINTVQHSVFVKRLSVPRMEYNYNWFIPYDLDNLYPNKIKSIAERSVTTMTAIWTHSDFLSGQGFGEVLNEIDVNMDFLTLEEILKECNQQEHVQRYRTPFQLQPFRANIRNKRNTFRGVEV